MLKKKKNLAIKWKKNKSPGGKKDKGHENSQKSKFRWQLTKKMPTLLTGKCIRPIGHNFPSEL